MLFRHTVLASVFSYSLPIVLFAAASDGIRLEGEAIALKAAEAQATGAIRLEGGPAGALGSWTEPSDRISWRIDSPEACRYEVELTCACAAGSEGSEYEISCGESKTGGKVHETGGWDRFVTVPVGGIEVPRGPSEICVRAATKPGASKGVMALRQLVLRKGFTDIFDGKSLEGWQGDTGGYAVKDGYLYCIKEKGGNLLTAKEYADFAIRFEFRLYPGSNNGLGLRTPDHKVDAAYAGMEIQILDDRHPMYAGIEPWQAHGSIYHLFPAKRDFLRKRGEWNVEEVICDGRHVVVNLNGTTIVDANLDDAKDPEKRHPGLARKSGFIGFLGHGSQVDFRKIRLKELRR